MPSDNVISQPRHGVLILTGPPGSGKTTVARLLTATRERAVHLESDVFWHFIRSGFVEPWQPESHEQNTLVMQIVSDVAARYACAGYFTVIDGIVSPRWFSDPLRAGLTDKGVRVAYVILLPSLSVAVDRATRRPSSRLADPDVIEQIWNGFTDPDRGLHGNVIDNGELTPRETAAAIDERLLRGALTV